MCEVLRDIDNKVYFVVADEIDCRWDTIHWSFVWLENSSGLYSVFVEVLACAFSSIDLDALLAEFCTSSEDISLLLSITRRYENRLARDSVTYRKHTLEKCFVEVVTDTSHLTG